MGVYCGGKKEVGKKKGTPQFSPMQGGREEDRRGGQDKTKPMWAQVEQFAEGEEEVIGG